MKLIPIIAVIFLLLGCIGIYDKSDALRGIYLNAWLAGNENRLNEYVVRMRSTGINTVIIHMQDTDGILPYDSKIPYAIEINATEIRIKNVSALVDRLHADGFYVIAKVDTFKDRKLAYAHPEYAFSYKNGSLFEDRFGVHIDPNNPVVWEYKKAIYEEMFDFGFDEVMTSRNLQIYVVSICLSRITLIFIFILQISETISLASILPIGFIRVSTNILDNISIY